MNLFAALTSFLLLFNVHPLHVSVTEIEMDEKDKRLEIMMRVFIDDLELTMRKNLNQPELDVRSTQSTEIDKMVSNYLKDHFKITLDNKLQSPTYIGNEVEDDAFIFYIEVKNVKKWKTIQVMDNHFMETHEDQSNLVHVTVREKVKSMRLTSTSPTDKLTFEFN